MDADLISRFAMLDFNTYIVQQAVTEPGLNLPTYYDEKQKVAKKNAYRRNVALDQLRYEEMATQRRNQERKS
jgi:hypothetical protein